MNCQQKTLLIAALLLVSASAIAQTFPGMSAAITRGDFGEVKAVLIAQHGEILFEEYYRGATANQLQPVFSVTKSVGSTLMGIANRKGLVDLNQGLQEFFGDDYPLTNPAYAGKSNITLEQVLMQRHGIDWDELSVSYLLPENDFTQMVNADDWYQFVLTRPMKPNASDPFAYSTGVSMLMSRVIREVSGVSPREFAEQNLFEPLGITETHWEAYSSQGRGNGQTIWTNTGGDEPLGFGLWLKPRDMLKLGELYRNKGMVDGNRLLDASWVEAAQQPYSNSLNSSYFSSSPDLGYGYQFWTFTFTDQRNRSWKSYYASGWGHQFILLIPELGLVVASVSDNYEYNGPNIGAILRNYVLHELDPALDSRFAGSWFDDETPGQGFNLEILNQETLLLAYWYTYDNVGNKRWFLMTGDIDGSAADVTIYQTEGGVFLENNPVSETVWGTGKFRVINCNHMEFDVLSAEVEITLPLIRLTGSCN